MALEPYDVDYFRQVAAEFRGLDAPENNVIARRARAIIERFEAKPDEVTQSELLELEQALIALQPTEMLRQRAPVIRLRYREVAGERLFAVYQPAPLPSDDQLDDPQARRSLVADLKQLMSSLHWRYALGPYRQKIENRIVAQVVFMIVAYSALWAGGMFVNWYWSGPRLVSVLATVVFAGIVGGFVSALRRMQAVETDEDTLLSLRALESVSTALWSAPLFGAIFAVVLMLGFASKLVEGGMFPHFADPPSGGFASILDGLLPTGPADHAKLYLWSFIAGFAERFVPDVLDRLIQRTQAVQQTSGAAAVSSAPAPQQQGALTDETPKEEAPKDEEPAKPAGTADTAPNTALANRLG